MRGQERDPQARTQVERNAVGQRHRVPRRHDRVLGGGAVRTPPGGLPDPHPASDPGRVHPAADRVEHAGPVLSGETTLELAVDRAPAKASRSRVSGGSGSSGGAGPRAADALEPAQREVFEALRAWRTSVAKEKAIPPYMVFSDATLVGIVEARPGSVSALGGVSGVGAKKLAEYGEDVLGVLAEAGS